jgi:hypothetical protein
MNKEWILMGTTKVSLHQLTQSCKNLKLKKLLEELSKWKVPRHRRLELEQNLHMDSSNLGI